MHVYCLFVRSFSIWFADCYDAREARLAWDPLSNQLSTKSLQKSAPGLVGDEGDSVSLYYSKAENPIVITLQRLVKAYFGYYVFNISRISIYH